MNSNLTTDCSNSSSGCHIDGSVSFSSEEPIMSNDTGNETANRPHSSYGGEFFHYFAVHYEPIHLPLSVIICLLGVAANTSNVIVLTRRSMITPTNIVLTGLSAAQLFLLVNYLLLLTFNVCARSCIVPDLHSYAAMTYKWINVNVSVAFHTTALCHTLVLAIFRFLAIKAPTFTRANLNARAARFCVVMLHLTVPILCAPTFFTSYVAPVKRNSPDDRCSYPQPHDLDYAAEAYLIEVAMWTFGIFFKLIPSILIVVLSFYLIVSLKKYNAKKDRLTGKKTYEQESIKACKQPRQSLRDRQKNIKGDAAAESLHKQSSLRSPPDQDRSSKKRNARSTLTKMLVIVSLFCVSVELPHGIVNLLTAIFGQEFGMEVYDNLGDLFEMLTLLYSSVNFILYCAMSTEFQRTFRQLFCIPIRDIFMYRMLGRPQPIKQSNDPATYLYRSSYTETAY